VLAISGDGSALFVLQSLWTAARHRLRVLFVVLNNNSYRILKTNLIRYRAEYGSFSDQFPHMDLNDPAVAFASLAEGFGVPGIAVTTAEDLASAMQAAFERNGPSLIDVQVSGSVAEELAASRPAPLKGTGT
jgi:benzoylformate decarboxylase